MVSACVQSSVCIHESAILFHGMLEWQRRAPYRTEGIPDSLLQDRNLVIIGCVHAWLEQHLIVLLCESIVTKRLFLFPGLVDFFFKHCAGMLGKPSHWARQGQSQIAWQCRSLPYLKSMNGPKGVNNLSSSFFPCLVVRKTANEGDELLDPEIASW
jgi:hypothetical protein